MSDHPFQKQLQTLRRSLKSLQTRAEEAPGSRPPPAGSVLQRMAAQLDQMEAAAAGLRQREQLFNSFLEHLPGLAWAKDLEGRYAIANRQFAGHLARPVKEVLGRSLEELWSAETVAEFRKTDGPVISAGRACQSVSAIRMKDGMHHLLITKFPIVNGAGALELIGGIAIDLSELKRSEQALAESEERYRQLVELSPNLVGITLDRKVAFLNTAGARMLGAATPEELLGRPVLDFVHPAYRPRAGQRIAQILQAGRPVRFGRETWLRVDGTPIEVEMSACLFRYHNAPAVHIVAEDVTERVRAEAKLKAYAQQLQSLSQRLVEIQETERRAIARELHDEVGQALTAIQINLQTALAHDRSGRLATHLEDSLALLDGLVQQTQNLSLNLRPSLLDDLGLAAALRWFTNLQASRAQLRARCRADPLKDRLEPAIETACFRIAQEALTNVVRHARARRVSVELRAEDDDWLHLVVRDDGVGLHRDQVRARPGPGAGLGLLGMEERAVLAGGRIEFRRHRRQGTDVHAWLPLKWRNPARPPKTR